MGLKKMRSFIFSSFGGLEAVAGAANRFQIARVLRVGLDLLADAANVDVDGTRRDVSGVAPDGVEKMVADNGVDLFRDSEFLRQLCCETRKTKPLRRAQVGLDAWVCGLRSGQDEKAEPAEWDGDAGLLKLNPLAEWDEARVWDYVRAHDIPYHPLHEQGFPTVDCAPCMRARDLLTSIRPATHLPEEYR